MLEAILVGIIDAFLLRKTMQFCSGVDMLAKVRSFDAFTDDNDPHGEHDFGSVDEAGVRCFWKVEYYDRAIEFGSPDPADPAVTTRVLTIMRADEY